MVEYAIDLDSVFFSLADRVRRDILGRVIKESQSIGELANNYKHLTFAAVAKHIDVLERSGLVTKKKQGRFQIISADPKAIKAAVTTLKQYQELWEARFNSLDELLK